MFKIRTFFVAVALGLSLTMSFARAADWPQWQGPDRTAVSKETGLLKAWPKDGPPLAWKTGDLGGGYSTPSVAAGRIYGMSFRGNDEGVWALEEKTGHELWFTRIADKTKGVGYGEGPRCTPTIDGDHLYALGIDGDLVCLNAATGKEIWHKNLQKDFGGHRPGWGFSESPLIDGDKLICTPGGKNSLVALNKTNGEVIWKATVPQGNGAQYSSIIVAEAGSQRQYIQFLSGGVVGVAPRTASFSGDTKPPPMARPTARPRSSTTAFFSPRPPTARAVVSRKSRKPIRSSKQSKSISTRRCRTTTAAWS